MNTKTQTPTQAYIHEIESRMRAQFSGYPPTLVATLDQLVLSGGRRIRPSIISLLGSMFNTEQEILLNLGAAVEMMHIATQVHDDLNSNTGTRTNQQKENTRFSTSATVLAGDFAFAAASQLAAATNRIIVMQKFSETLQFIVNGEISYLFNNGDKRNQKVYYDWVHSKTASIFELGTCLAARLGSANQAEVDVVSRFGYNLGMAFHLTNDVLDFTGDPSRMDKPTGDQLRQGILTLPALFFMDEMGTQLDINQILNNNGNGHGDIDNLITQIHQSDAIEMAAREADRFLKLGLDALSSLPRTPQTIELEYLAQKVTQRDI